MALIGLTKLFWEKHNNLVKELEDLGITTIEQAELEGLDEENLYRLRMARKIVNNPEIDLWNREARFNHGLPF